jgi:putative phage-type endonuclease
MNFTIEEPKIEWPDCEIIAKHADLTEAEWRKLRKSGIGGSDAGAILKLSRYASPLTVCMEKTGRAEDFTGNEATEVGKILEPLLREHVLADYLDAHGFDLDVLEAPYVYRSKQYPWMLANIDGVLIDIDGGQIGLEIKTGGSYQLKDWGSMDGDELPDTYYAQVQHYIAVTGATEWFVFGLIGNRRLHRLVSRNDDFIAGLIEREEEIWKAIEKNDPLFFPLATGLDADDAAVRMLSTPITGGEVDLSEIEPVVDRYKSLSDEINDMTKMKKEAQQIIKQKMGTAKSAVAGRYQVSRTAYTKSQFDASRFAKEHPEEVEDYMKEIEIDFPRVKESK